ncbi:MAG: alpha/beta hydrolase [Gemmatimonadaceae bacterium]
MTDESAPDAAPSVRAPDLRSHPAFHSRFLDADRDIDVYLPPGYDFEPERRYPVLYLHDGQNLFDPSKAFGNSEWRVDDTADALIAAGEISPLIIVGIGNGGEHRIHEYTPTRDGFRRAGGKASLHGRMLVEELKPFIDVRYRTLTDRSSTGLGGSSLGGLVSLYLGLAYPEVYGKLAVISPSVWWDNRFILRRIGVLSGKPPLRVWLSTGTAEGPGVTEAARRVRDVLLAKGWALGEDLHYLEAEGAPHHEYAWSQLVAPMLRYLYPPT